MSFAVSEVSPGGGRRVGNQARRGRLGSFLWLVRREIWERRLDQRLAVGASLCVVLSLFSALSQVHAVRSAREEENARRARWRASIEEQLQRDENLEVESFRLMSPLAVLAAGLEPVVPVRFTSTKEGLRWGEARGARDLVEALFGTFDLTFVAGTLFSLLAIVLTYDSVCGELGQGTLGLLLSYPVSRLSVLLAKVVASSALICCGFSAAFLVVLVSAVLSGFPLIDPANWLGYWWVAAVTLTAWTALGVTVSVWVRRPATAALVGLVLWVIGVFLVPRGVGMVVEGVYPPRRLIELNLQEDEEVSRLRLQYRRRLEAAFGQYVRGAAPDDDRRREFEQARKQAGADLDRSRRQVQERLWAAMERLEREREVATTAMALLSPEALFRQTAAELSWTGFVQRRHFYASARLYHEQIGSRLAESRQEIYSSATGSAGQVVVWHAPVDALLIPYSTTWAVRREIFDDLLMPALGLALYGPLFFAIGLAALSRLEIRS